MPDQVRHDEGMEFMIAYLAALLAVQPPDCGNATTQHAMNQCAAREANEADADLNFIYPQVLAHFQRLDRDGDTQAGVQRLRAAQRAWVAFRDAECALAGYEALGGSLEPLLVSGCEAELTKRRSAELRQMLTNR
jgi:uncharacterized protein YecT (DUF1311 family)